MSYLSLTTGFGLKMYQTSLTLHENSVRAYAVLGIMLLAISMCVAGVGV